MSIEDTLGDVLFYLEAILRERGARLDEIDDVGRQALTSGASSTEPFLNAHDFHLHAPTSEARGLRARVLRGYARHAPGRN